MRLAAACWILTIFITPILPVIFYLGASERPYLRRQAALCVTVSSIEFLALAVAIWLTQFTLMGLFPIAFVTALVLIPNILVAGFAVCILGALESFRGEDFRPPLINDLCAAVFKL